MAAVAAMAAMAAVAGVTAVVGVAGVAAVAAVAAVSGGCPGHSSRITPPSARCRATLQNHFLPHQESGKSDQWL